MVEAALFQHDHREPQRRINCDLTNVIPCVNIYVGKVILLTDMLGLQTDYDVFHAERLCCKSRMNINYSNYNVSS